MTDSTLIESLLNGQRLSVFLCPDQNEALKESNGYESYIESYPLPFVFIEGEIVWGATGYNHTFFKPDQNPEQVCCFYYCSDALLYAITCYADLSAAANGLTTKILSGKQYTEYFMRTCPAGKLVWRLGDSDRTPLEDSIREGNPHYVVLRFSETRTVSLPLDLIYCFQGDDTIEFRTAFALLSGLVDKPRHLIKYFKSKIEHFEEMITSKYFDTAGRIETHVPFYRIRSDGTAVSFSNIGKDHRQKLLDIKVYAVP